MCYTEDVEREEIKNYFWTTNNIFRCTEQTKGYEYMEENNQDIVKLLDFYDQLGPLGKLRFQKLLREKIEELKAERDAQNEQQ